MNSLIIHVSKIIILIATFTTTTHYEAEWFKTLPHKMEVGRVTDMQRVEKTAPIRELFRRSEFIYEPSWISALPNHKLLIADATHQMHAVYVYDLVHNEVEQSIRTGNGPGELAPNGMKWLSKLTNGDILIYDTGNFRAYRFDSLLKGASGLRMNLRSGNAMNIHLVHDSVLYVNPMNQTDFLQKYHYDGIRDVREGIVTRILVDDHLELKPLRNFLLKNGFSHQYRDHIYYSFLFAPYIVKVGASGVEWIGGSEMGTGFPTEKENPNQIKMPDAGSVPQQTISITADDNSVYVLHNGNKVGFWKTLVATVTSDYSDIDELVNATDRLRIYDAATGRFRTEWTLPVRARLISVYDKYLYVSTQTDGTPEIIVYEILQ